MWLFPTSFQGILAFFGSKRPSHHIRQHASDFIAGDSKTKIYTIVSKSAGWVADTDFNGLTRYLIG